MRKKNKTDNCELCNKEFEHYSWDSQKYCSKECSYNKDKIKVKCIFCGKECNKSKSVAERNNNSYCSRDCYNLRNNGHKKLKRGTAYYQELLNTSSCSCGETKKYLLQIHHMDGNHNNNVPENLEVVCPTCHVKRHLKKNKLNKWVYHPKSLTDRNLLKDI